MGGPAGMGDAQTSHQLFLLLCLLQLGDLAGTTQAMQLTFFFFLPSMLLSGFMFPFRGMPGWAQAIGEVLPLTHFLRVVRGIMLKGNGVAEILPNMWPILLFMLAAGTVAMLRYRQTLD